MKIKLKNANNISIDLISAEGVVAACKYLARGLVPERECTSVSGSTQIFFKK
jgi:hypothetical protein